MYIMLSIVIIAENDWNFTLTLKKTKNTILIMGCKLNLMQQGMVFTECWFLPLWAKFDETLNEHTAVTHEGMNMHVVHPQKW